MEQMYRISRQYSANLIGFTDMEKLIDIAKDYKTVKNYVYNRYGGIRSKSKLYPGYTIQNEMTVCGLRQQLNLPSVYYYLAVYEAIADIKTQWTQVIGMISKRIKDHEDFTSNDRHYLRFVIKNPKILEEVLLKEQKESREEVYVQYQDLGRKVNKKKLDSYLNRQTRKYLKKLYTDKETGFSISEKAYRYGDHGIFISTKEKRKRVFIPLTDNNQYKSQLQVRLFPEEGKIELQAASRIRKKKHLDYDGNIGVSLGFSTMITTSEGRTYGTELGSYILEEAEWMREKNKRRREDGREETGKKKYSRQKNRYDARLYSYINQELNRFIEQQKPQHIYIIKLPGNLSAGYVKRWNHALTMWQRGYIRKRLKQKCCENNITIVEIIGKGLTSQCSSCGNEGTKAEGLFCCQACGLKVPEKENTAKNVLKRGLERQMTAKTQQEILSS